MTIQQIYELAIKLGIQSDFRGEKEIDHILARRKERYEKLSKKEKQFFDLENLTNPYSDTRILTSGNTSKKVKKIMVGIDISGDEVLASRMLGGFDLLLSHHPAGPALAALDEVMHLQADIFAQYGVPIAVAQSLMHPRIEEVSRGLSPSNHQRTIDLANLLGVPYMCAHTPTDNLVAQFLRENIEEKHPKYVSDLMDLLMEIPEYQEATKLKTGPRLFSGTRDNHCGKIAVAEITGGTEGAPEMYHRLAQAGISTVIAMHLSEKHTSEAKAAHVNAIIAGHMSSDSIGVNLFLDTLEKVGIEIAPVGGFIRVSRVNSKSKY